MGSIAKIISTKIGASVSHVLRSWLGANVEPNLFSPAGIDAPGLPDDKALIVRKDGSGKFVCLGTLNLSQGAKAGELVLYSRDSNGAVKSKIYLNQNEETVFNDGTDFAVAFEDLKAGFDAFVSTFNTHTHPTAGSGPPSTPTIPSTDTIDGSKVPKVRLP